MKTGVLGCGRWGTFLAWYAQSIGHEVRLWGRENSARYQELQQTGRNEFLTLPESVILGNTLEKVVDESEQIIISISAQQLRPFGRRLAELSVDLSDKIFILCMKGIEAESGKRLTEVLAEEIGADKHIAVWVGPGHVQDFMKGIPNCMLISSNDMQVTKKVVEAFNGKLIRFYYGRDLIGIEIGAAAKNVMGLAAGMLDGLHYSSLKGALMARGTHELSKLVMALGGERETIYGLSHLGDYEATLFSLHSNNRRFGEDFVGEKKFKKLAEGVPTVKALMELSVQYKLELPICQAVYEIIFENKVPQERLLELFLRPVKCEF